ncbi:hypothetical protein [Arthrobacter ramosus]|uniref:hypothetical protein n=1 Tax=Arthrobacter ramosus TaxID=1672 RepID=UPI001F2596BC|nr:hypothetical protein [Arthrobacter ramosus]
MNSAESSPTPRNAIPTEPAAAPATSEPLGSSPPTMRPVARAAATRTFATNPCATVTASGAQRPAGVAETSSARPDSSSARVCRTARNVLMNPARSEMNAKSAKNVNAPSLAPRTRPRSMRIAGVAVASRRTSAREASSP